MLSLEDVYPTTLQYQPLRDDDHQTVESSAEYVLRMQNTLLPHWPAEVLREWLHRHANFMEDYAFLGFGNIRFDEALWPLERIPGREAFRDKTFCDNFQNIEIRAAENSHDWLAHYMLKDGTWNTPIVLLKTEQRTPVWVNHGINTPHHLLEGHRRLSFLQGLKRLGRAQPVHALWIVKSE